MPFFLVYKLTFGNVEKHVWIYLQVIEVVVQFHLLTLDRQVEDPMVTKTKKYFPFYRRLVLKRCVKCFEIPLYTHSGDLSINIAASV